MATMKATYSGGKKGGLLAGLKTKNPPVNDSSRPEIGRKYPDVNKDACRHEPSVQPPTIGPRTA